MKTDGFAGVERGVGGVAVPSNIGVLSPVLLPSSCKVVTPGTSVVPISVSSGCSFFSMSYPISCNYMHRVYWCI